VKRKKKRNTLADAKRESALVEMIANAKKKRTTISKSHNAFKPSLIIIESGLRMWSGSQSRKESQKPY
jgi:hypothetical protein